MDISYSIHKSRSFYTNNLRYVEEVLWQRQQTNERSEAEKRKEKQTIQN